MEDSHSRLKTYDEATVVTRLYGSGIWTQKSTSGIEQNRECRNKLPYSPYWFSVRAPTPFSGERTVSSTNDTGTSGWICTGKNEIETLPWPNTQIKPKWIIDLNVKLYLTELWIKHSSTKNTYEGPMDMADGEGTMEMGVGWVEVGEGGKSGITVTV